MFTMLPPPTARRCGTAAWASSKGAIRSLTRGLAKEWGQYGITVNTVMPGVATPETWPAGKPDAEWFVQVGREPGPLKRLGRPATDVAPLIAFYLSEEAGWTTGAVLLANGGTVMV